jgi:hypothetical protein
MNTEQPTANTQQNTNRIWFLGRFVYFIVCQPWVSFPLLTFLFLLGRQGLSSPKKKKSKQGRDGRRLGREDIISIYILVCLFSFSSLLSFLFFFCLVLP